MLRVAARLPPSTSTGAAAQGLFGRADLATAEDLERLRSRVEQEAYKLVERIVDPTRKASARPTVRLFDDLSNLICSAADLMDPRPDFQSSANEAARRYCHLVESLNTHQPLYERVRRSATEEATLLEPTDKHTLGMFLDDFEQSGVHLDRDKFVHLSGDIFDASSQFQMGCERSVSLTPAERSRFGLAADQELCSPHAMSNDAEKRHFVYDKFMRFSTSQERALARLVGARHELALLTDFPSFAHRAQQHSLLGSYESTRSFLLGVLSALKESAEEEQAILAATLRDAGGPSHLTECDLTYAQALYEKALSRRASPSPALRRALTAGRLLDGFERLCAVLYDCSFERSVPEEGECWPAHVLKLHVLDSGRTRSLGHIYLDLGARASKTAGDCHYTVRCSKLLESGEWQTPIVVLSLGVLDENCPPSEWQNAPIGVSGAENLFHELGHAMHSMLGRTTYQHVAGTRCPPDFSEIPSNLMEYFFKDARVLHWLLSEGGGGGGNTTALSLDDVSAVLATRCAFTSLEIVQQAMYGLFDLELHTQPWASAIAAGSRSSSELFDEIRSSALPNVRPGPGVAFQHRFAHLVSYGARYYSYIVARSAASQLWHHVFKREPFSRDSGLRWAAVQNWGGGRASADLLADILGRPPTAQTLVGALRDEATELRELHRTFIQRSR